ncbi:MAG: SDR family oxidoreductase [Gemmatimonadales bacterium]|nr:MAG: SDR family oxidoreductase [Gemmatimonadales bacterium]
MKTMSDKRVLVTGAGTGIGRGIALAFAAEGAIVALHYSRSGKGAETAVEEILAGGGKAAAFKADFREVAPIRTLAREAVAFLGGLDVLVNNAGITMNRPFEKTTVEQFDTLYAVNVRAPYFMSQAVVPDLEKSKGVIINIASIHAFRAFIEHTAYAGTRGAIVTFTRNLAIDLAPRGIRVVGLAPGAVPVPSHFKSSPGIDIEKTIREFGKSIPSGFAGTPRDIGEIAVFLASPAARYIVGQTLVADGGTTTLMHFGEDFKQPMTAQFGQGYVPGV